MRKCRITTSEKLTPAQVSKMYEKAHHREILFRVYTTHRCFEDKVRRASVAFMKKFKLLAKVEERADSDTFSNALSPKTRGSPGLSAARSRIHDVDMSDIRERSLNDELITANETPIGEHPEVDDL